jgi:hypothetical protein
MNAEPLDDMMSMTRAAKAIGMERKRAQEIAIRHRIAIRWGGSDRNPYLRVSLRRLKEAIGKEWYTPKVTTKSGHRFRRGAELHPFVKC